MTQTQIHLPQNSRQHPSLKKLQIKKKRLNMNPDNITPALPKDDSTPPELTAEEFQRYLYTWFEDRGLLDELRAHLRTQMIAALRESSVSKAVHHIRRPVSPKVQAINLLIAEFLRENGYLYTLSVFSCEAPMVVQQDEKWARFPEKDMWDILETLGILRGCEEGRRIVSLYCCAEEQSDNLLSCILRVAGRVDVDRGVKEASGGEDGEVKGRNDGSMPAEEKPIMSELKKVLSENNINLNVNDNLVQKLKELIETEHDKKAEETKKTYSQIEAEIVQKAIVYHNEYQKKLESISQLYETEKKRLEEEQRLKQNHFENYSEYIKTHNEQIRSHLNKVVAREQALEQKEAYLMQLQMELEQREKLMKSDKFAVDNTIEKSEPNNNVPSVVKPRTSMAVMTDYHEIIDSVEKTTIESDETLRKLVQQMQKENEHLRNINMEQLAKIQGLSRRASSLCRELEGENRRTSPIRMFHNNGSMHTISSPPLIPETRLSKSSRMGVNGAGEEGVRVQPTPPPRTFRNLGYRRRASVRKAQNIGSTTTSGEDTPTDEVLEETRNRLRLLEKESEEIDRNFQKLHKVKENEEKVQPQSPGGNWLDSCKQNMFDVADFFYNDDGLIPNTTWPNLNDLPGTSTVAPDFNLNLEEKSSLELEQQNVSYEFTLYPPTMNWTTTRGKHNRTQDEIFVQDEEASEKQEKTIPR